MDSGTGITRGGSEYAALLAHAGRALYGMELGSVTLKRIGFFCFPIKHSTYTTLLAHAGGVLCGRSSVRYGLWSIYGTRLGDLKENWFPFVFQLNTQHTLRELVSFVFN